MIITIDGPVASGKSSVARALAHKLNFYYLYTGLLYRAVAYIVLTEGRLRNPLTEEAVRAITTEDLGFVSQLVYRYHDNAPHIAYRGIDITSYLCDAAYEQPASLLSANPNVRAALLEFQRTVARAHDVIADGRDCGSVVFPHADIKFFLTADVDTRARRLWNDQTRNQGTASFEDIKQGLIKRDERDQHRAIAPLIVPEGAVVIDSSHLTFEQTIQRFLDAITHHRCSNITS
jgi:cytidylate kinase